MSETMQKCKLGFSEWWVGIAANRLPPTGYLLALGVLLEVWHFLTKVVFQKCRKLSLQKLVFQSPQIHNCCQTAQLNCIIVVFFLSTSSQIFITLIICHL